MQQRSLHLNDGSGTPARLEVQQSWWAMAGNAGRNAEWSMEEKFERISQAGFTGILGRLPIAEERKRWRRLLDDYHLNFGVNAFPSDAASFSSYLKEAKDFGVQYVNAQVADAFVTGFEAVQLLGALIEAGEKAHIPFFIETHRGTITQDLIRTAAYAGDLPRLSFTLDISHYLLAGEMETVPDKAEPFIDSLLKRTSCFHGRISNGQQIQVDRITGSRQLPFIEGWWKKGMSYWLEKASPGDVLPFVCELGPPGYAITTPGSTAEISDRWEESLLMKNRIEQCWREMNLFYYREIR